VVGESDDESEHIDDSDESEEEWVRLLAVADQRVVATFFATRPSLERISGTLRELIKAREHGVIAQDPGVTVQEQDVEIKEKDAKIEELTAKVEELRAELLQGQEKLREVQRIVHPQEPAIHEQEATAHEEEAMIDEQGDIMHEIDVDNPFGYEYKVTLRFHDAFAGTVENLAYYARWAEPYWEKTLGMVGAKDTLEMIDTWLLSEKLGITNLQNKVMYSLLQNAELDNVFTDLDCINFAFSETQPGSPLRRFFAEELLRDYYKNPNEDILGEYGEVDGLVEEVGQVQQRFPRNYDVTNKRLGDQARIDEFMVQE
jgi:hypothetical protein